MHLELQTEAPRERPTYSAIALSETALLSLRQWYQTDGSDRARLARHLEFLRLLVRAVTCSRRDVTVRPSKAAS